MSDDKHSPGPWLVGSCGDEVTAQDGMMVVARRDWRESQDDPVMRANMLLIAAAPEMLELLRAEAQECSGDAGECYHGRHDRMAALIARIDGEAGR